MTIVKIERQQVVIALRATGSSDADVLFARKEELLAGSRRLKLLGTLPLAAGALMCVTIVGAVFGVPVMVFGWSVSKRVRANIENADAVYAEYLAEIANRHASATS